MECWCHWWPRPGCAPCVIVTISTLFPLSWRYNWNIVKSGVKNHKPTNPLSWRITVFSTLVTHVSLVEQELLIIPQHLYQFSICNGIGTVEKLVLHVEFSRPFFSMHCLPFDFTVSSNVLFICWVLFDTQLNFIMNFDKIFLIQQGMSYLISLAILGLEAIHCTMIILTLDPRQHDVIS